MAAAESLATSFKPGCIVQPNTEEHIMQTVSQPPAQAPVCDHVVGFFGPYLVRQSQWPAAIAWFSRRAAYFVVHNPRTQIPHPGVIGIPRYCTDCGAELPDEILRAEYMAAMDNPDEDAVASMTKDQYMQDGAKEPSF